MKENVGSLDRTLRSLVGPALIAMGSARILSNRKPLLGILGVVAGTGLTESALTRVCPLSAAAGIDTRSPRERERDRLMALFDQ